MGPSTMARNELEPPSSEFWQTFCFLGAWWGVSAVCVTVAYLILAPESCSSSETCIKNYEAESVKANTYICCGLATLLIHEALSLASNYRSARTALRNLNTAMVERSFLPGSLIAMTFAVLLIENMIVAMSETPWYAFVANPGVVSKDASQPVFNVVYLEWLVDVPILLVIAGRCALRRPWRELTRPVLITNVYIVLSWACFFIADANIRWALICLTFVMYGWASWGILRWTAAYQEKANRKLPGRTMRLWLPFGLVSVFGVYGAVYLGMFTQSVSGETSRNWYKWMDVSVKVLMSIAFGGIRGTEYYEQLFLLLMQSNVLKIHNVDMPYRLESRLDLESAMSSLRQPILENPTAES